MTILEYIWHIAKYSVFGVRVSIDSCPDPIEITGVNVRTLEFETVSGVRIFPKDFTNIRLFLYPLDHLYGDALFKYQAWSKGPSEESQEKFLERINNLEKLLCSNHIDYLGLIKSGLAIDATGKNIYGYI